MKKIAILVVLLAVVVGLGFYFRLELLNFYSRLTQNLPQLEIPAFDSLVKNVEPTLATPSPLRAKQEAPQSVLTKAGVINLTNDQRTQNGLPALKENAKLDSAALAKAQDMLKNQYFEHVSPAGAGPQDLAKSVGYAYLAYGENLAMGNFADDKALVEGWMASPGHRANILNSSYREIGVAVVKGKYEDKTTWLAVQEFGLPLSACAQPDSSLKNQIDALRVQADNLAQTINDTRAQIQSTQFVSRSQYNQAVQEYNDMVNQYNALVAQNKTLVKTYNAQVASFNVCAGG